MAEQFERVARPSSVLDSPGNTPPFRGINRNHLTLLLTIVGVLSAAAGAGINSWMSYYRFHGGEQQKAVAEAGKNVNEAQSLQTDATVHEILNAYNKNPAAFPKLDAEIRKLHSDLEHSPAAHTLSAYEDLAFAEFARRFANVTVERRKLAAEARNQRQDTAKKIHETESAERDSAARRRLLNDRNIERLGSSADAAAGGGNTLGMPRGSMFDPPPISRGAPGSLGSGQGYYQDPDPIKYRGPGRRQDEDPAKQRGPIK